MNEVSSRERAQPVLGGYLAVWASLSCLVALAFPVPELSLRPLLYASVALHPHAPLPALREAFAASLCVLGFALSVSRIYRRMALAGWAYPVLMLSALAAGVQFVNSPSTWWLAILLSWIPWFATLGVPKPYDRWMAKAFLAIMAMRVISDLASPLVAAPQFQADGLFRLSGLAGNPNFICFPLVIGAISFSCVVLACQDNRRTRALYWFFTVANLLAVALTLNRAGGLALIVSGLALASVGNWSTRAKQILGCFVVAGIYPLLIRHINPHYGHLAVKAALGRTILWHAAADAWSTSPAAGLGFRGFLGSEAWRHLSTTAPLLPEDPKNVFLNLLCETGLLGLALIACLFIAVFKANPIRQIKGGRLPLGFEAGKIPFTVALLTGGLFDTPIWEYGRLDATVLFLMAMALSIRRT